MAKWGEGDPRWIVEQRPDGANVNNWHWAEKNAKMWSEETLKGLLSDILIMGDTGLCSVDKVKEIEGDAFLINRKGKIRYVFDWNIKLSWAGTDTTDGRNCKGTLDISDFNQDDGDKFEFAVTFEESQRCDSLRKLLETTGLKQIQERLNSYIQKLKEECSQGLLLPQSDAAAQPSDFKAPDAQDALKLAATAKPADKAAADPGGVQIKTRRLEMTEEFRCSAEDLYRVLTSHEMMSMFTRTHCTAEPDKGGRFSLLDGNITGWFTELVAGKRVAMQWRLKSWRPEEHYSSVVIELAESDDRTVLRLTQSGVPANDFDPTLHGWSQYYWEAIKQTFGYGARFF